VWTPSEERGRLAGAGAGAGARADDGDTACARSGAWVGPEERRIIMLTIHPRDFPDKLRRAASTITFGVARGCTREAASFDPVSHGARLGAGDDGMPRGRGCRRATSSTRMRQRAIGSVASSANWCVWSNATRSHSNRANQRSPNQVAPRSPAGHEQGLEQLPGRGVARSALRPRTSARSPVAAQLSQRASSAEQDTRMWMWIR
jgi:hypothetical protein